MTMRILSGFKVNKGLINEKDDIYIGTYYASPCNKNNKHMCFFTTFNEEIRKFKKKGVTLVQGDFNARTACEKDFIEADKSDSLFGLENLGNQNLRNSEDQNKNPRGNELLDVCKLNDMLILNGRKPGDLFGSYTCHNWNGSSVVDYVLSPNPFCNKISNFSVGRYIPWLSDHCIVKTTILLNDALNRKTTTSNVLITLPLGFYWNEHSKSKYKDGLQSPHVSTKLNELFTSPSLKPAELALEIKNILMDNAITANLRPIKESNKSQQKDKPWFDRVQGY